MAAQIGHWQVVCLLVAAGAKNTARTTDGATPLYIAARQNQLQVVRFLIAAGAGRNNPRALDGTTPLFIATQNGHFEVAQLLLRS